MMHGKGKFYYMIGTFTYKNGDKYEGDWCNDKKEGMGMKFHTR